MFIKEIYLKNFRNYDEQKIELNESANVFFGNNAQGKTNILEAIFLSSFGKSFRTSKEKEMIRFGQENLIVETEYKKSKENV